jgi:hypothetical protein
MVALCDLSVFCTRLVGVTLVFHSSPFEPFTPRPDVARVFLNKLSGEGLFDGASHDSIVWDVFVLVIARSAQAQSPHRK